MRVHKYPWISATTHLKVKPLGKTGKNNWGGMGVTLVDSLDTLWLMGLTEEFYNGRCEGGLTCVVGFATLEAAHTYVCRFFRDLHIYDEEGWTIQKR